MTLTEQDIETYARTGLYPDSLWGAAFRRAIADLALRGMKLQAELDAADKAIVALIAEQRATDVAQSEATGSMSEHAAAIDAARKAAAERWGK